MCNILIIISPSYDHMYMWPLELFGLFLIDFCVPVFVFLCYCGSHSFPYSFSDGCVKTRTYFNIIIGY